MDEVTQQIEKSLAEPFELAEIKWKPQAVNGNRALAIAYVDARVIQDRLDQVCGVSGWQDSYEFLPDGSCICRLQIRLGGEWIMKMDVGGQSEQQDEGDRRKAALSDALKRAAVKFGVGRYLYRLPSQWVDYDPQKKRFARTPTLPDAALPARKFKDKRPPADGAVLLAREQRREKQLVSQKRCQPGELITHLRKQASLLGRNEDVVNWSADTIKLASDWIRTFLASHPAETNGTPASCRASAANVSG